MRCAPSNFPPWQLSWSALPAVPSAPALGQGTLRAITSFVGRASAPPVSSRSGHRLDEASVTGSGILETAIRLELVSATVQQLPRSELAGRAFETGTELHWRVERSVSPFFRPQLFAITSGTVSGKYLGTS